MSAELEFAQRPRLPALPDLSAFLARASRTRDADAARVTLAGRNLIRGALRIRRGGDGIYGDVAQPITKPAEAIDAWLGSMEREIEDGPFHRSAEALEALAAAAEEVDAAARATPAAERLKGALYADALAIIGQHDKTPTAILPWIIASLLGGILIGVLVTRK